MLLKMILRCLPGDIKLRGAQHQKIKESASFTIAGAINRLYFRLQVDTGGADTVRAASLCVGSVVSDRERFERE